VPSASDHEEQASQNEAFFKDLGGKDAARSDWAMTALFYTALHEIQALAIRKGWRVRHRAGLRFPEDHNERLQVIATHLAPIEAEYRSLKDWSEHARYRCGTFTSAQLALAEGTLKTIRTHLKTVP
jgi:hypothetical protein